MHTLKIVTWNVGFGGMGKEADIKMAGGRRYIPSSFFAVRRNIHGIKEAIANHDADVFLLQEISRGSLLNYWHNLEKYVVRSLKDFTYSFAPNFKIPLMTKFLRNEHGLSTYMNSKYKDIRYEIIRYKKSETYYKVFKRKDSFLASYITLNGKKLAVINTHLASFDANTDIKMEQCEEVLQYGNILYKKGYEVVIGADWNMNLKRTKSSEECKNLTNISFPTEKLPQGWQLSFSEETPSVRATNNGYIKGKTGTAIIDGFVCSPGVSIQEIHALDFGFTNSDHNPIEIVVHI